MTRNASRDVCAEQGTPELVIALDFHKKSILNRPSIRLGLDIDGTITSDPPTFVALTLRISAAGGEVHVVTSRSELARAETIAELRHLGLKFKTLHMLPSFDAAQRLCPHEQLDWYQKHQWLKVDYAVKQALTHFVDDDPKVAQLFERFAPKMHFIFPTELERIENL